MNLTTCVEAKIPPLIAIGREEHHPGWRERFTEPEPLAEDAGPPERMKYALKTKAGRTACAPSKQTVEPVFGIIKSVMGFRQFLLRGLANGPRSAGFPNVRQAANARQTLPP